MSQSNGNRYYTNHSEARAALNNFKKAMVTIRTKYTKPGQADRIIESLFADKFGSDVDLSVIMGEYASGKYDMIVGRIRQAARVRGQKSQAAAADRESLLAEMTALYCGIAA
jgi:hypothetical protein